MFCTECGARVAETAKFCQSCGTRLAQPEPAAPSEPYTPPSAPAAPDEGPGFLRPEAGAAADRADAPRLAGDGERGPEALTAEDPTARFGARDVRTEPYAPADRPTEAYAPAERPTEAYVPGDRSTAPGATGSAPPHARDVPPPPGPGELAGEFVDRLRTPGPMSAAIVGAVIAASCLVTGIVVALIAPDPSISRSLIDPTATSGFATRALIAAVGVIGGHGETTILVTPLLFLVPIGAGFVAARMRAARTRELTPTAALAWCALGAVLAVAVMLILGAIADGSSSTSIDLPSILFAGLLTTLVGVVPGAVAGLRVRDPEGAAEILSERARTVVPFVREPLRMLAGLYAAMLVLTAVVWTVQTARGQERAVPSGDVTATAVVENLAFSPHYATSVTAGALLASDRQGGPWLPGDDARLARTGPSETGNVFDLSSGFPPYVYLPLIVLLLGSTLIAATYSGFAVARTSGARTPALGAAYGAVTGVVWSIAMVVLRLWMGADNIVGGSLFLWSLVLGCGLGAVGGSLALGGTRPAERTAA